MPQALPARPNLVWLRKAANKRLAELHTAKRGARLQQLAVALDCRFPSWRALKAHMTRRAPRPSSMRSAPRLPKGHGAAPG